MINKVGGKIQKNWLISCIDNAIELGIHHQIVVIYFKKDGYIKKLNVSPTWIKSEIGKYVCNSRNFTN